MTEPTFPRGGTVRRHYLRTPKGGAAGAALPQNSCFAAVAARCGTSICPVPQRGVWQERGTNERCGTSKSRNAARQANFQPRKADLDTSIRGRR